MSGLTKEESNLMDAIKHGESTVGYGTRLVAIINRLVAENEELKTKLDAIKKAWEPFKSIVTENKHMESFALVYDDDVCVATFGALRTLDKLIGGEE